MNIVIRNGMRLLMVAVVFLSACNDRNAEKKIAQLESRLAELESKNNGGATPVASAPAPAPVPSQEEKPSGPLPVITFQTLEHDFGTINEGEKVEYEFQFTNTGEAPLIVQNTQASCGCTVPEWTKVPVAVGKTGKIKVQFDSNGKVNAQNKTVTVTSNTWPKQTILRFKAMVMPKTGTPANGPVRK